MRSGPIGRCAGFRFTLLAVLVAAMGHLAAPGSVRGDVTDAADVVEDLAQILVPQPKPVDPNELAGVPAGIRLHELTLEQAYTLAIVRVQNPKAPLAAAIDTRVLAEPAEFARFCTLFLARAGAGAGGAAFRDPAPSVLGVLEQRMRAESRNRSVETLAHAVSTVKDLIKGDSGNVEQRDVDLLDANLERARNAFADECLHYRDRLDALRRELGLSPHVPVVVSDALIAPFRETFDQIEAWHLNPNRHLSDLPTLVQQLAPLESRSFEFGAGRLAVAAVAADRARLEPVLRAAEGLAVKNHGGTDPDGAIALQIRTDVRHLVETHAAYERLKRELVGRVRLKDGAIEAIVAPPVPNRQGPRPDVRALAAMSEDVIMCESRIVSLWASFHIRRLALARALGIMPEEDWGAFRAAFAAPLTRAEPPLKRP